MLAQHSSASSDWGTPPAARDMIGRVLEPAAKMPGHTNSAIDVDAASSVYWQRWWKADHCPTYYFTGEEGRDALSVGHWDQIFKRIPGGTVGSVHCNPPAKVAGVFANGDAAQRFYRMLSTFHAERKIDSVAWTGYNIEQFRTLLPDAEEIKAGARCPLDADVCTIVPSSRISYLLPPQGLLEILSKKLAEKPDHKAHLRRYAEISAQIERGDDAPVDPGSPSHSSYFTFMWSHARDVRREQQARLAAFLDEQQQIERSPFYRARAIGLTKDQAEKVSASKKQMGLGIVMDAAPPPPR